MASVTSIQGFRSKMSNRYNLIRYLFVPVFFIFLCTTLIQSLDYRTPSEAWQVLPEDTLATRLQPAAIMSRPLASGQDMVTVPKYLHQSWMSDELPARMLRWSQTCRAQHRHWNWVLWKDQDNLKLVEDYFPWFLSTYRSLPAEINRADTVRNMYMYLFGGVYADLDTECLQPFDDLFGHHDISLTEANHQQKPEDTSSLTTNAQVAIFGRMGYDGTDSTLYHTIPNAWMAATPGHPFFLLVLEKLQDAVFANNKDRYSTTAEDLTGPVALYHAIEAYRILSEKGTSFDEYFKNNPSYSLFNRNSTNLRMEILPPENIFPYSWNNQGRPYRRVCWAVSRWHNSQRCKQLVTTNQTYAITYWSHTWNEDLHKSHDKGNMGKQST